VNRRVVAVVSGIAAVALAAALWGFVGPDGSGDEASGSPRGSGSGSSGETSGRSGSSPTGAGPDAAALTGLVGSGCADYALSVPSGPGSVTNMAGEPLLTALAGSPLLRTWYAALSGRLNPKVDLTDRLRSGSLTVFAPVDSAFALLPAARVARLRTNAPALRALLRSHLVAGALDPSHIVGTHRTLAGSSVTVAGSGGAMTVDRAQVICGGLGPSGARIYLIGSVLPVS
jgi:uncharacterized surface protein with fasciclin (FAS1) repeats